MGIKAAWQSYKSLQVIDRVGDVVKMANEAKYNKYYLCKKRQMISMKKIFGAVLSVLSVASVVGFIFFRNKNKTNKND